MFDLLTPDQTARALATTAPALVQLVNAGRLPAYDLGGAIRFRAADVAEFVAEPAR